MSELPQPLVRHLLSPPGEELAGDSQGLPTPAPLDLAEIPLVRATRKLEKPGPDGGLPRDAHYLSYVMTDLAGVRHQVEISGSSEYGLPYGGDSDVLIALFKLVDEHGLHDGVFRDASYRMIMDALGQPPSGHLAERIQGALRRLSQVRIMTTAVQDAEQLALQIQTGHEGSHPLAPTTKIPKHTREQALWLLEYDVRKEYRSGEDGESFAGMWIDHLALSPFWVAQCIGGWVAWIDLEIHSALKSPVAKGLYRLMAAQAARGFPAPWLWHGQALAAACALDPDQRPAEVRRIISKAAESLVEAGVLSSSNYSGKRGRYTFVFEPGPTLETAAHLRGVGLLDLKQLRVQVAVLRHFGIQDSRARQMVLEDSGQVREILQFVLFLRECRPNQIRKSYAAFISKAFKERWSFAGDESFESWLAKRRLQLVGEYEEDPRPLLMVGSGSPGSTRGGPSGGAPEKDREGEEEEEELGRVSVTPVDGRAEPLWENVLAACGEEARAPGLGWTAISHLGPYQVKEDRLVVVAEQEFFAEWLRRSGRISELEELLSSITEGEVSRLELKMLREVRDLDDA